MAAGQVIKTITNPNPEGAVQKIEIRVDKTSSAPLEGAPTTEEIKRLNMVARAREAHIKYNQEHDSSGPFFQGDNKSENKG